MALIDQIKQALADAQAKLAANTSVLDGISTFITGLKQQITDLQTALANAGTDPAALQEVADGLATLNANLDAQAVAEAAVEGNAPPASDTPPDTTGGNAAA